LLGQGQKRFTLKPSTSRLGYRGIPATLPEILPE